MHQANYLSTYLSFCFIYLDLLNGLLGEAAAASGHHHHEAAAGHEAAAVHAIGHEAAGHTEAEGVKLVGFG